MKTVFAVEYDIRHTSTSVLISVRITRSLVMIFVSFFIGEQLVEAIVEFVLFESAVFKLRKSVDVLYPTGLRMERIEHRRKSRPAV